MNTIIDLQHRRIKDVQEMAAPGLARHTGLIAQKNQKRPNLQHHLHHRVIICSHESKSVAYGYIRVHGPEIAHDHVAVRERRYAARDIVM
ncbi:hypothetical protein COOONC_28484 [Cooperia oncophora]